MHEKMKGVFCYQIIVKSEKKKSSASICYDDT